MLKNLLVGCGNFAGKLVISLRKSAAFVQVIKNTTVCHVYNHGGFFGSFTSFLPNFFHATNYIFITVSDWFLTSFHSTYYYERLSNISYIN